MLTLKPIFRQYLLLLVVLSGYWLPLSAATGDHPVLIISSYNPDAAQTSNNISDFMDEFKKLGQTHTTVLENMNCKSFSESPLWVNKMRTILSKYSGNKEPSLVLLIGQEAWAAYLSLCDSVPMNLPVMAALGSKNAILLPDDDTDLKTCMPPSVDFFKDFSGSPVKAGFVYEYDVDANIRLIKSLYPRTKNIAFISDNSYGGVSLQAYVIKEMKKFPELNLILLDGRVNTIYTVTDRLHSLPANTALLMGTWRVDMNDGYFMRNATYSMMEAAPHLPTFSLTSVGLGYWAIGGVVPNYRVLGRDLAKQAAELLRNPQGHKCKLEIVSCQTVIDEVALKAKGLDVSALPQSVTFINTAPSFYKEYRYQIWAVVTVVGVLVAGLLISLLFYYRTKKLKDELQESEVALREAKDKAEESSRLKSAFLANMSHEIRTPLNAIVGFSDVLSMGSGSEEEQRNYFDIIKTNSDLLLRLINDILDVSRLESGRMAFNYEEYDAVQICKQILPSVAQARKSQNQFVFQSHFETLTMDIDIQRLQQVIINLLSNADKFTTNGTITLTLAVEDNMALFSVADTGCGIPPDKLKMVFERFEKLNEYVQGTGLGLSICNLTVKKWGGKIWIDPHYTGGACFHFTHPLKK